MNTVAKRYSKTGVVIKESGKDTVSVLVEVLKRHPLYKKVFKSSKKYLCHTATNEFKTGDKVEIISCRPISKRKSWRVFKLIERKELVS